MAINRDKVEGAAIKLLQPGKYDKAIIELKKLVDDDKTDVRTLLKLGDTHVKLGSKKESIEAYEKAAAIYTEQGFYLKAVAVFKQILRVDPNIPELHLKLAELYQQLGLTSDALQHYQNVAVFHEQQGRPRDALDMLKRMVDLDPDNIASRIKLGEMFAQQGLAAEAVNELRSALGFLKQQQRFDDYVRVGEKLVAYDQNALDVARELATIYMQRQQPSVALGKLQMCFKADPRNVEILAMIAQTFLEMQQVVKTVQVFNEMAKIYTADGKTDLAMRTWERVLELQPDNPDAEQGLGRKSPKSGGPQTTRPTLAPTVVAPAQAAAPMQQPAVSGAQRHSAEDEQLQRLLTETDVYVKYGLRDKAIEHLQKVFVIRADHVLGLEKQKILQLATQAPQREIVDTLTRLVRAAEAQGHARVDEWRSELTRMEQARPASSQPAHRQRDLSSSGEGEIVITDAPSQSALPQDPIDDSGLMELEPRNSQEGAALSDEGSLLSELPPDEPEDIEPLPPSQPQLLSRSGRDEHKPQIPRMPTGVMNSVGAPVPIQPVPIRPAPMKAPAPAAAPPPLTMQEPLQLDDAVDVNDADALVRKALQDISAEDVAAALDNGELLLEASDQDILGPPSGEGPIVEDDNGFAPRAGPSGDDDEIDRLAREAVDDANRSLNALDANVAATALMGLNSKELEELRAFENDSSLTGSAFHKNTTSERKLVTSSPLSGRESRPLSQPVGQSASDDEGFNDPTLALPPQRSSDVATDEKPRRAQPQPHKDSFDDVDQDAPTIMMHAAKPPARGAAPLKAPSTPLAAQMATPLAVPVVKPATPIAATPARSSPAPRVTPAPAVAKPAAAPAATVSNDFDDEFDPSSFDLPPDVKEMLRKGVDMDVEALGEFATSTPDADEFDLGADLRADLGAADLAADAAVQATQKAVSPMQTAFSAATISAATMSAGAPAGMNGDNFSEISGEITLRGKLGLEAKVQGFEDDPANQFFPDELEESEFFIQQELLDEAKEILTSILDDVPDSARVQWMLARIAAKEGGESEPPAPWEQRILEEVQQQLDDLGLSDDTLQQPALEPGLGSGTGPQISVEEVLSQFKKGVAETVPEDDAATHYELGIAYREMGLHDDAVNEFQIAGRAASRAVDSRFMVGNVRKEQGRLDEAVAALEEALQLPQASRDQRGAAEYERGVCLTDLHRPKDALRALKSAKANGSSVPDLDRRIAALIASVGDDGWVPPSGQSGSGRGGGGNGGSNGSSSGNGSSGSSGNGHGKPGDKPAPPGRGPKNIDYL